MAANDYLTTAVTNNHFEPGTYKNTTIWYTSGFLRVSRNATTEKKYGDTGYKANSSIIQLFNNTLEGFNPSPRDYEDLTPLECARAYNTDFLFNRSNLFLITKHNSNTTHDNTILDMIRISSNKTTPNSWMCGDSNQHGWSRCNTSEPTANLTSGFPWWVKLKTGEEVEVAKCKSEITEEKCKVRFSLGIMIVVIWCNLVKACCMVMAVVRSREPTLVTLGDARVPNGPTSQVSEARPDRQPKLMSVTRPDQ